MNRGVLGRFQSRVRLTTAVMRWCLWIWSSARPENGACPSIFYDLQDRGV